MHDDVIGTRKVSYIIYLTNPDETWGEAEGGHLELYGKDAEGDPALYPAKRILPTFNSMAMFAVQPGTSFHAVQEVFAEGRPRMSIQGWFHGPEGPEGKQRATVNQLLAQVPRGEIESGYQDYAGDVGEVSSVAELTDHDRAVLGEYINSAYLKEKSSSDIRAKFEEDSCVLLHDFLKADVAEALKLACLKADAEFKGGRGRPNYDYHAGEGGGWRGVGPTHKQRFLEYTGPAAAGASSPSELPGPLLKALQTGLFESVAFAKFLAVITSMAPTSRRGLARRFRPGLDYTVAHFGTMVFKPRLSLNLCFVDDFDDDATRKGTRLTGVSHCHTWPSVCAKRVES